MSRAFVICAFCGARIRADRGRCLRCGELLEAAAPVPVTPTLRDWLQTSNPRTLAIVVLASIAVLIGAAWFIARGAAALCRIAAPACSRPHLDRACSSKRR